MVIVRYLFHQSLRYQSVNKHDVVLRISLAVATETNDIAEVKVARFFGSWGTSDEQNTNVNFSYRL